MIEEVCRYSGLGFLWGVGLSVLLDFPQWFDYVFIVKIQELTVFGQKHVSLLPLV